MALICTCVAKRQNWQILNYHFFKQEASFIKQNAAGQLACWFGSVGFMRIFFKSPTAASVIGELAGLKRRKYKSGEGNLKIILMLPFGDYLLDVTALPRRIKVKTPRRAWRGCNLMDACRCP